MQKHHDHPQKIFAYKIHVKYKRQEPGYDWFTANYNTIYVVYISNTKNIALKYFPYFCNAFWYKAIRIAHRKLQISSNFYLYDIIGKI